MAASLLLEIWRDVGQHLDAEETLARALPLLQRELPVDQLFIRTLGPHEGVQTVAAAGDNLPQELVTDCTASQKRGLLEWCRAGTSCRHAAAHLHVKLPRLAPSAVTGDVFAVPLRHADSPAALLLVCRPAHAFQREHSKLLKGLCEPFTAAWASHCRLRELQVLRAAAEADTQSLLTKLGRAEIADTVVGADAGLRHVMKQVELVAGSDVPVLILGETGSGKEVVARAIHMRSRCAGGAFLRVNCGAIAPELLDSELFGHEKGSFTGASGQRSGWFERADGGTLFLDECGELPMAAQVRLLRILQDGTFHRVGGEKQLHVSVRVIAATHRDLHSMASEGRFREDLWYRLAVFPIVLPPLRERLDDIPALATHLAQKAARRLGLHAILPNQQDLKLLCGYSWPGNVRELGSVIERAAILGNGLSLEIAQALGLAHPPRAARVPGFSPPPVRPNGLPTLDEAMKLHIETALAQTLGRVEGVGGAADLLAINPHTLRSRMRKLGVIWTRFRERRDQQGHNY